MENTKCEDCDGRGEIDCPGCVDKGKDNFDGENVPKVTSCATCGGSQRTPCRSCNGSRSKWNI